ncbi:MAG: hypothetical protein HFJ91_06360 [Muribaculaceae bacterium]|nr:hypothetical protein [Muribaculaceae bacterium]
MSYDNQFFSMGRLTLLAKKETSENWRTILLFCAGILGVLTVAGIFIAHNSYYEGISPLSYSLNSSGWFVIWCRLIMVAGGLYLASVSFHQLSTRTGATQMLMVPASGFEKFLMRWLAAIPIYVILSFVIIYIADLIRMCYASLCFGINADALTMFSLSDDDNTPGTVVYGLQFMVLIYIQSLFFLGSAIWPRRSMLKTIVTIIVLAMAYFWFGVWIMNMFSGDVGFYSRMNIPAWMNSDLFPATLLGLVSILNYWLTYRRFCESEIINRW